MKRIVAITLIMVYVLALIGCSVQNDSNGSSANQAEEKIWTKQDISSMFSNVKETDWTYIDCVVIPDYAYDRVGAVLFWNEEDKFSNVAFFDSDGFYQMGGIFAETADQPDFTYLGDGTVSFQVKRDNGTVFTITITLVIDGSSVHIKVEDV